MIISSCFIFYFFQKYYCLYANNSWDLSTSFVSLMSVEMTCLEYLFAKYHDVKLFAILTFYRIRKTQLWKKLSFCFYLIYLWFESPKLFKKWNIKLNTTATILARTIPFNSIPKKLIDIPLSPVTNTTEVKIKFWLFE